MQAYRFSALLLIIVVATIVIGCTTQGPEGPVGPAGPAGPLGPLGPAGDSASASQSYIGSDQCGSCHEAEYQNFVLSGHPYKLTKIENGEPPKFPYDEVTGGVAEPPEGYTWGDISYVIGGYGWKARFIDQQGYIITGDEDATTQYNYANEDVGTDAGWVPYHAGEVKPYDCGSCHTTGFNPIGNQDGLEGIEGTWAFTGIQCEECHGPGGLHVLNPGEVDMVIDTRAEACGKCHNRGGYNTTIPASGGFTRHHEQGNEHLNSPHKELDCVACHDPHVSTVYQADQAIRTECESCHASATESFDASPLAQQHAAVECIDCHMPPMAKSAVGDLERFTGDVRSHQFSINPDPEAPQFDEEGAFVMPYITLDYACRHCHNGEAYSNQDLDALVEVAVGYHDRATPTPEPSPTAEPSPTPDPEATATP